MIFNCSLFDGNHCSELGGSGHEDWKDIDKFYFIPLYLEMFYCIGGIPTELAPDPVWLGSFIRNTLDHPDMFQYQCPKCGKTVFPFRYVGSPLSGRVDLEGYCDCGWKGYESVSGWFVRGEALRNQLDSDKLRYETFKLLHLGAEPASSKDLLKFIGLRDEDLILPPEKHKITRTRLGKGRWLVGDSAGGFVIEKSSR